MYSFSRQWTSSSDAKIQVINIKVSGTLALHKLSKISDCYCDRFYVFLIMKHFAHTWVGSCCQIMNKSCRLWSKWLVNPELQNSYLPRRIRSLQTPIKHILPYFIFIPQDLCSSQFKCGGSGQWSAFPVDVEISAAAKSSSVLGVLFVCVWRHCKCKL